ncbi:RNA-binding transcriptional accessory protein [Corynebacterium sp. ES2794-CONJ1]|uniref:Tex family protein n=1 Tax=unclassified Corynebacterium TaxID=2624378 RepID=UPI0021681DFA|nr:MULTISPECIES: Tex family protein [unclassified Corynebacterium]MCS4490895.1 RNA-binding transcriptional accessory protein [Corynebacterium sp. ES2715-CONJ3]MCU9518591.1 RNA-binding transcriptional accessory protein [Corynebacterium sp. ES2794-CONJ1]
MSESAAFHVETIATELSVDPDQVRRALALIDAGNTVPFIARYRKEHTGGLDDSQLRHIHQRSQYLEEFQARKHVVLSAIDEQGKLTPTLRELIAGCENKARLEDLYAPYKKRRKTKADTAREAGLEALLDELMTDKPHDPDEYAARFIHADFPDIKAVHKGALAIFVDRLTFYPDLLTEIREAMFRNGVLSSQLIDGKAEEGAKYADYFDFCQPFHSLPSHRILAIMRGEKEGILKLELNPGDDEFYIGLVMKHLGLTAGYPWLDHAVRWGWKTKLYVGASLDTRMRLNEKAEAGALDVFARNLKDVLLAAPAGQRTTLGLDPGYRHGVKCAVIDGTGKVLDTAVVYPHQPHNQWDKTCQHLTHLCQHYAVELIAIGNGTASRETEKLATEIAAATSQSGAARPIPVVVSESGASVYSASELAAQEFPDMDVSLRGAVSIARRLQDPLAELVKIDPKAIGVGQYQHDVNQAKLASTLDAVVEDAVNGVGVDLNTASHPLLTKVAGITPTIASHIISYRNEHGSFSSRAALKNVPRLGPRAFEQCAGFLRVTGAADPLDASAVHPEAYPVVRAIARSANLDVADLIGNTRLLSSLNPADFADDMFGVPTVVDILAELDKPGRDPRPEFKTAVFKEGVTSIGDVQPGMILEGTVTNVAQFGAFVDIGVHQDGLVHISAMSEKFISDPHEVVRSGQVVRVKVLDVDPQRHRISLSMRLRDEKATRSPNKKQPQRKQQASASGSLADAMRRAGLENNLEQN